MQPRNGFGDWGKVQKALGQFESRVRSEGQKALLRAGWILASMARDRLLTSKGMMPLSSATGVISPGREGGKPLLDQGAKGMLGSIAPEETGPLEVTVAVQRTADDGTDIASVHSQEIGTSIRVTPRMRAFLHHRGIHLKRTTKAIFIPGRPFMLPAYEDFRTSGEGEKILAEFIEGIVTGA